MSHRNQIKLAQILRHHATLLPTNVSEDRYLYQTTGSACRHTQVEANRASIGSPSGLNKPVLPVGISRVCPAREILY